MNSSKGNKGKDLNEIRKTTQKMNEEFNKEKCRKVKLKF